METRCSHPSLEDVYSSIDHVKEVKTQTVLEIQRFYAQPNCYSKFVDIESEPPKAIHGFHFPIDIPKKIIFGVKDCINYLRTALDYLGYAAATAASGETPKKGTTYFPFAATKSHFEPPNQSRSKNIPKRLLDIMLSYKGYGDQDGNKLLYAMNEIRNIQTHAILCPMARHAAKVSTNTMVTSDRMIALMKEGVRVLTVEPIHIHPPIWDAGTKQLKLVWTDARISKEIGLGAAIYIAFGNNVHYLATQEPIGVIDRMIDLTEEIVANVALEGTRTGIFK